MAVSCTCCRRVVCSIWKQQFQQFHSSTSWFEKKTKKTFDFKTIQQINAWKKEDYLAFGPVVGKKTVQSSKDAKKRTQNVSTNIVKTDTEKSSGTFVKTKKSICDANANQRRILKKDSSSGSIDDKGIDIPKISPIPPHQSYISEERQPFTDIVQDQTNAPHRIDSGPVKGSQRLDPISLGKSPDSSKPDPDGSSQSSFNLISQFPFLADEISEFQLGNLKSEIDQLRLRLVPSVKNILNKTMPDLNRFFLNRWREKMIRELGEEGFKQHQAATINRGANFHDNLLEHLNGRPLSDLNIMEENQGHWASLGPVLRDVQGILGVEMAVSHPHLGYRGILDCLALYRDKLCVIDWKTSQKPRPDLKATYDAPVQVAAYLGALNASPDCRTRFGPVQHGVLVVAYTDGSPADIHPMDLASCQDHWTQWTRRLTAYYRML